MCCKDACGLDRRNSANLSKTAAKDFSDLAEKTSGAAQIHGSALGDCSVEESKSEIDVADSSPVVAGK